MPIERGDSPRPNEDHFIARIEKARTIKEDFDREFTFQGSLHKHYIVTTALTKVRFALENKADYEHLLKTHEDHVDAQKYVEEYLTSHTEDGLDQLCIEVRLKQILPEDIKLPESYHGLPVLVYAQEAIKPFSWETNDEIGDFRVIENEDGIVHIEIANNAGDKILLNDLLPEGYEAIGNKRVMEDDRFSGLENTDTSVADLENKVVIVSEAEVKREGRRYMLLFLHELGHIMRHQERPELKEQRDSAYSDSARRSEDIEAFKRAETLIVQDERDAWAFAIREYRKLIDRLGLPKEKIFENADELKKWMYQGYLGATADYISRNQVERFAISEEEKERLSTDIFKMYTHKESR